MQIQLSRILTIPDPIRLERLRRCPDLGPKILFFSGGTALREACREIVRYSHNTIHLITPFDSGGSSAKLRDAFHMPAIGDVRNRLLALADQSLKGNPEIFRLFSHRFPEHGEQEKLLHEIQQMIKGKHPLVANIPDPMRKIIRHYMQRFHEHMPVDFDLKKASIGNLILTGGYLETQRHTDPVIFIFSKLVNVLGIVRPVIGRDLHLIAELEDGTQIIGQHNLTGKEVSSISSKVVNLYISNDREKTSPVKAPIRNKIKHLIADAELICYPIGSFFSSLLANLLPKGVGTSVAKNSCPKVYIPNTATDPEAYGLTLNDQVDLLLKYLRKDNPSTISEQDVLNFLILDEDFSYEGGIDEKKLKDRGIEVLKCPLVSSRTAPYIDEELLVPVLFSMC